jgi:hypothetical protein
LLGCAGFEVREFGLELGGGELGGWCWFGHGDVWVCFCEKGCFCALNVRKSAWE